MKRKVLLSGPLVLLLGLIITPALGQTQTPAEQLSALTTHVDGALAQLDAGDLAGAQAEYQAFDDGWFDIEDGIREQSRRCGSITGLSGHSGRAYTAAYD